MLKVQLTFNLSTDSGSNYNVTKTSHNPYMLETNSSGMVYRSAWDLAIKTLQIKS